MTTSFSWALLAAGALAGSGFTYYVGEQREAASNRACAHDTPASAIAAERGGDDMLRRRLEGIGSTRDLKPVPLPPGGEK